MKRNGSEPRALAMRATRSAFPDWTEDVEDVVVEGQKAATRVTIVGTNTGPFQGRPPSGRKIVVPCTTFYRCFGGRVEEVWSLWDAAKLAKDLAI